MGTERINSEAHLTYPGALLTISKGALKILRSEVNLLDAVNVIFWTVDMSVVREGLGLPHPRCSRDYKTV